MTPLIDWPYPYGDHTGPSDYCHALVWGTRRDGWREDAIYTATPYSDRYVQEIVLDVRGKRWIEEGL